MNLAHWLERTAIRHPQRPAVFIGADVAMTYGALLDQARHLAGGLVGLGVGAGDRVAVFMKNQPEYLVVKYAVWLIGAAIVPINAKLHPAEVAWIHENSGSKLLFASEGSAEVPGVASIEVGGADYNGMMRSDAFYGIVERSDDDLAWLFYTSGTTGRPKGVIITHGMLMAMALAYYADVDQVRAEDFTLYAAPMSHGAGLYSLMHVQAGAGHVFPRSGGFDPLEIFDLAGHFGSVHMFAAPTMITRMTRAAKAAGASGEGLRTVVYAGGPMYLADIVEAVDQFGPIFVQIYGQGECPMAITALSRHDVANRSNPDWQARVASVGRAQSVVEVAIGDENGHPLATGNTGEIMVRGAPVMPGYWQNPLATAKTLKDGWLMTGDVGRMDAAGYVTLVDRSKDLIISGGTNIYPREVEEALLTHPAVAEVAVVGQSEADWGEIVVAFVVRTDAVDETELDAHCLAQIARFKRPKKYVWVDDLPKNNYGKVLKTELREFLKEP